MNRHEFARLQRAGRPRTRSRTSAAGATRRRRGAYGIGLVVDADGDAHATGDADRLLQALSNLVENALRVTPAGGTVRYWRNPAWLAVEDDGPGLPAAELPHAFERFYLYSRYAGRRPVGTGLGLAIVDGLARAMGGRVEVRSGSDGTRFSIHLPPALPPGSGVGAPVNAPCVRWPELETPNERSRQMPLCPGRGCGGIPAPSSRTSNRKRAAALGELDRTAVAPAACFIAFLHSLDTREETAVSTAIG